MNECLQGLCSHDCHNTQGSYYCSCPPGMDLDDDGHTCTSKSVRLSVFLSVRLSVCLSVCLFVCLFVCFSICLFIYLSICL